MKRVYVYGAFDDIRSGQVRFLQEAAKHGMVNVLLWTDDAMERMNGKPPIFPLAERKYFLESIRYVSFVTPTNALFGADAISLESLTKPAAWAVHPSEDNSSKRDFCFHAGLEYVPIPQDALQGFPPVLDIGDSVHDGKPKVVVTGCYDWFHTGHIRFFEEASAYGDLYVVVGHDANLRHLKGEGHPMFPQQERRYMVQSVRFVYQALISSGDGWLDAEPEIGMIKPDIYLVNEDGDREEKRLFCERYGIRYIMLKRTPKDGLPRRESTQLRGF